MHYFICNAKKKRTISCKEIKAYHQQHYERKKSKQISSYERHVYRPWKFLGLNGLKNHKNNPMPITVWACGPIEFEEKGWGKRKYRKKIGKKRGRQWEKRKINLNLIPYDHLDSTLPPPHTNKEWIHPWCLCYLIQKMLSHLFQCDIFYV